LTFGINRIERQTGFPRSANTRHNDQLVSWKLKAHVLEIVNPGPSDNDGGKAAGLPRLNRNSSGDRNGTTRWRRL
jgi:hypothetical protein